MTGPADPIAFEIAGFEVRWYAIFILLGIVAALAVSRWLAKQRGADPDFLLDAAPWIVLGGILGARLYYIALKWRHFADNPEEMPAIREGGLAVHGAILGGLLALWLFCRYRRQSFLSWADVLAAALPFGQAIGRWGNWANNEAFGKPTDLPWGIEIPLENRPAGYEAYATFHPTFLYESLLDLTIGLVLVTLAVRQPKDSRIRRGDIFALYMICYGIVRTLVESIRLDSVYIDGLRVAYLASALFILTGVAIMTIGRRRSGVNSRLIEANDEVAERDESPDLA